MKERIIVYLLFAFVAFSTSARTYLGVEELATKAEAKKILLDNYGYPNVRDEGGELYVEEPIFAGFPFSYGIFEFIPINGILRFNSIYFHRWFEPTKTDDAKKFRDTVMNSIKRKYIDGIYEEEKNEQGFKCCYFGPNDRIIGYINLFRRNGKDEKERLYVELIYFDFDPYATQEEL